MDDFTRAAARVIPIDDGFDRDSRAVLPANGQIRLSAFQPVGK